MDAELAALRNPLDADPQPRLTPESLSGGRGLRTPILFRKWNKNPTVPSALPCCHRTVCSVQSVSRVAAGRGKRT